MRKRNDPLLPPPNSVRKVGIIMQRIKYGIWGRCPKDGGGCFIIRRAITNYTVRAQRIIGSPLDE
jgi:hypothetical protein